MVNEIELFESPELAPLGLIMGADEERSIRKKGGYKRRIASSHLSAAVCIKKHEDQLKQHAIFAP